MVPLAGDAVVAVCLFNMSKVIYVAFKEFQSKNEWKKLNERETE